MKLNAQHLEAKEKLDQLRTMTLTPNAEATDRDQLDGEVESLMRQVEVESLTRQQVETTSSWVRRSVDYSGQAEHATDLLHRKEKIVTSADKRQILSSPEVSSGAACGRYLPPSAPKSSSYSSDQRVNSDDHARVPDPRSLRSNVVRSPLAIDFESELRLLQDQHSKARQILSDMLAQTGVPVAQTGVSVAQTGVSVAQTGVSVAQTGVPVAQTGVPVAQTGVPVAQTEVPVAQHASSRDRVPSKVNGAAERASLNAWTPDLVDEEFRPLRSEGDDGSFQTPQRRLADAEVGAETSAVTNSAGFGDNENAAALRSKTAKSTD